MTKILKGPDVAEKMRKQTLAEGKKLRAKHIVPKLAILRVGKEESSFHYEKSAKKEMKKSGIEVESFFLEEKSSTAEVLENIEAMNKEPSIHGVIIMQPLPEHLSRTEISNHLDPRKDVDGIHPINLGRLVENHPEAMPPSTAQATLELLDYYHYELEGADVVVIGSSPVVGKPLSLMLLNRGASVSNLHIHTKEIKMYSKNAELLISATGTLGLIDAGDVKEGATVIDVGYGCKEGEIRGDVHFEEVKPHVSAITPVPGGIGSVTTAVLASHVIKAAKLLNDCWN